MDRDTLKAAALIIGTQIGAGVLGLPFAIKGLGFFWGTIAILLASLLMFLTALFLLESLYVTNPNLHLFDLLEAHFGRPGAILFLMVIVLAVYGALSAYLDGITLSLLNLIGVELPGGWVTLLVWGLLTLVVAKGLRVSSNVETAAVVLMGILFFSTTVWALAYGIKPYFKPLDVDVLVTAFSVSVFAFFAHLVIPEVIRITRSKKKSLEALKLAFSFTTVIYIAFSLAVIGILGEKTSEISVFGLAEVFGEYFSFIAYLIPLLTMLTSFLGVGLGTTDMVKEFLKSRTLSLILVLLPPLFIHYLGLSFFSSVLLGSFALVLAGGIVPSLLLIKLKRERLIPHRAWVAGTSLLVFIFVLIWQIRSALLV